MYKIYHVMKKEAPAHTVDGINEEWLELPDYWLKLRVKLGGTVWRPLQYFAVVGIAFLNGEAEHLGGFQGDNNHFWPDILIVFHNFKLFNVISTWHSGDYLFSTFLPFTILTPLV